MKRPVAQKILHRVEHVLVSSVIVLVTSRSLTQMQHYTIAVEDVLATAMMSPISYATQLIRAKTTFIIVMQSVLIWRERYHWNVMTQVCLGDVLVASRALGSLRFI